MRIGLFGVPIETLCLHIPERQCNPYSYPQVYLPHYTDTLRREIVTACARSGVRVENLGELCFGEDYWKGMFPDVFNIIEKDELTTFKIADMQTLMQERERIQKIGKAYDLMVGIGPSHLCAIVLYSLRRKNARTDYHGDFFMGTLDLETDELDHANYMIWIRDNLPGARVNNYFVRSGEYFGALADPNRKREVYKHHDIDVDCFGGWIQDVYDTYNPAYPATGKPEIVWDMIEYSRPDRIGVWEYRMEHDPSGEGVEFIAECIKAASGVQRKFYMPVMWHKEGIYCVARQ